MHVLVWMESSSYLILVVTCFPLCSFVRSSVDPGVVLLLVKHFFSHIIIFMEVETEVSGDEEKLMLIA